MVQVSHIHACIDSSEIFHHLLYIYANVFIACSVKADFRPIKFIHNVACWSDFAQVLSTKILKQINIHETTSEYRRIGFWSFWVLVITHFPMEKILVKSKFFTEKVRVLVRVHWEFPGDGVLVDTDQGPSHHHSQEQRSPVTPSPRPGTSLEMRMSLAQWGPQPGKVNCENMFGISYLLKFIFLCFKGLMLKSYRFFKWYTCTLHFPLEF